MDNNDVRYPNERLVRDRAKLTILLDAAAIPWRDCYYCAAVIDGEDYGDTDDDEPDTELDPTTGRNVAICPACKTIPAGERRRDQDYMDRLEAASKLYSTWAD